MDTSRLTMPPSPQKISTKKSGLRRKIWLALGFGVLVCASVFYFVHTLQGFHGGRIVDTASIITAGRDGMLDLAVSEGQQVDAGAYLGSVEGAALREQLAKLEQQLAPLELALPLEYGGFRSASGKKEPLAFSDEALRDAQDKENAARAALNAASLEEAKMGVASRRVLQRHHQGKATKAQVTAGGEAFAQAQAQVAESLTYFETVSAQRAAIESERKRIREIQAESGLAAVPVDVRIKEYEALKAQRDSVQALYEQSVFFAQVPSVVEAVQAEPQSRVEQGQPILTMRPTHNYRLLVKGQVSRLTGASLRQGGRCEVDIPSYSRETLEGTILSLVPVESGWRNVLPEDFRWTQVYIEVPVLMPGPPISPDASVSVRFVENANTSAKLRIRNGQEGYLDRGDRSDSHPDEGVAEEKGAGAESAQGGDNYGSEYAGGSGDSRGSGDLGGNSGAGGVSP